MLLAGNVLVSLQEIRRGLNRDECASTKQGEGNRLSRACVARVTSTSEIRPALTLPRKKMICEECKQPVAEINFHGSCVAYCENWECPLYRQHEVTKVKVKKTKKRPSRKGRPSYKRWLKQRRPKRRERYHAIRSLGIGFKEALMFRDRTSMTIEDIKERTKC